MAHELRNKQLALSFAAIIGFHGIALQELWKRDQAKTQATPVICSFYDEDADEVEELLEKICKSNIIYLFGDNYVLSFKVIDLFERRAQEIGHDILIPLPYTQNKLLQDYLDRTITKETVIKQLQGKVKDVEQLISSLPRLQRNFEGRTEVKAILPDQTLEEKIKSYRDKRNEKPAAYEQSIGNATDDDREIRELISSPYLLGKDDDHLDERIIASGMCFIPRRMFVVLPAEPPYLHLPSLYAQAQTKDKTLVLRVGNLTGNEEKVDYIVKE